LRQDRIADTLLRKAIYQLKGFNEVAEMLLGTRFAEYVSERAKRKEGLSLRLEEKEGERVRIHRSYPDEHMIAEFAPTFRIFWLSKDEISFRHLERLYRELPISDDLRIRFHEAKNEFIKFMGSSAHIDDELGEVNRKELCEIYLYGGRIHLDRDKRNRLKKWMSDPVMLSLVEYWLTDTFVKAFAVIRVCTDINRKTLEELEKADGREEMRDGRIDEEIA